MVITAWRNGGASYQCRGPLQQKTGAGGPARSLTARIFHSGIGGHPFFPYHHGTQQIAAGEEVGQDHHGGVHGYETSGVHGALRFAQQHAAEFAGRANLLVVPCVSPWAYERFQRWNFDAIDPNRAFKEGSPAQESAALMQLVAQHQAQHGPFAAHIDLHETTDTDESEYRPAVAARDGKVFEPGSIPDGFYLVDDTENPQPAFQQAIIDAVGRVTHIAPADDKNEIIGSPVVAPGVIRYQLKAWGLCASVSGARYTTTTEVYPDSPRATPEQCIAAQVAAVCAAVEFVWGTVRQ